MKRVKSIVIVGGGSSGWMTAAYLSTVFYDLEITLIESAKVPVIGVGEATVPSLTRLMTRLGYRDYQSWLSQCDGTLKTGISFCNWYSKGDHYWHPFEHVDYVDDQHHIGHCWLQWHHSGMPEYKTRKSFYDSFYVTNTLNCEQKRGPVVKTFAYHLNADMFGQLLRRRAAAVRHILDDVLDVQLNEAGDIDAIVTSESGLLKADLYIDCTGFRKALMRKVDSELRFESYAKSLFCDRAVVLRFPYGDDRSRTFEMNPFVRASAESNGWIWTIPLFSRISSGYVYSSSFCSESDAEAELRRYWGEERTKDAVPHKVKFETGKLENIWVRNCVAIGLAGGFIEPLESTGLAITQSGVEMLASVLDARCYDDFTVVRYNNQIQKFCRDIIQFIIAHYCFTSREDTPFWKAVKYETEIPDDLNARLDVFRRLLPTINTKGMEELWFFRDFSWFSVLLGMNFPFEAPNLPEELLDRAERIRKRKQAFIPSAAARMPSHFEFLKRHVYDIPAFCTVGQA